MKTQQITDQQRQADQQLRLVQAQARREMDRALRGEQPVQSEVAQVRQRIQMECEAMQRSFSGFAATARHEIIHNKYAALAQHHQTLSRLIGEEQAAAILTDAYVQSMQ